MVTAGGTAEMDAGLIHSRCPAQAEEVPADSTPAGQVNMVNCFSVDIGFQRFLSASCIHWPHSLDVRRRANTI